MLKIEELAKRLKKLVASVEGMESGQKTLVELFSAEDANMEDITEGKASYRVKVTIKAEGAKKIMNWVYDSEAGELHFIDQNSGMHFSIKLLNLKLSGNLPDSESL